MEKDFNVDTAKNVTNIALGIFSAGIVPLIKLIARIWKDGAEEREKRREYRLRLRQLKKQNKK